MFEPDFTAKLGQAYRETPVLSDEREFLAALEARIAAAQRRRRQVLAACGLLGAGVSITAVLQFGAPPLARLGLERLLRGFEQLLLSIDVVAVGGVLLLALLLRELLRTAVEPD